MGDAPGFWQAIKAASGQFPLTVAGDYINKAEAYFPNPSQAVRELVDDGLAPHLARNTPHMGGGALRMGLHLSKVPLPAGGVDGKVATYKLLRISNSGQPFRAELVRANLSLGHEDVAVQPQLAETEEERVEECAGGAAAAAAPTGKQAQGAAGPDAAANSSTKQKQQKVYGVFGHGMLMALGKLAHHAFWLCQYTDEQGHRHRWAALAGQCIAHKNVMEVFVLQIPHKVATLDQMLPHIADVNTISAFLQAHGKKGRAHYCDNNYPSPWKSFTDLIAAFDEMACAGETLRLDMYLAKGSGSLCVGQRSPSTPGGSAHYDIWDEQARAWLSDSIRQWYMPYHTSFQLRAFVSPPSADPPPCITIQDSVLDWEAGPWPDLVARARYVSGPFNFQVDSHTCRAILVLNERGVNLLKPRDLSRDTAAAAGGHDGTSNTCDLASGWWLYLDSDRALSTSCSVPACVARGQQRFVDEVSKRMMMVKVDTLVKCAYPHFLDMAGLSPEDDPAVYGLPSEASLAAPLPGQLVDSWVMRVLLRWLVGADAHLLVMLDRGWVMAGMLDDKKTDLKEGNAPVDSLYHEVFRAAARHVWEQRAHLVHILSPQLDTRAHASQPPAAAPGPVLLPPPTAPVASGGNIAPASSSGGGAGGARVRCLLPGQDQPRLPAAPASSAPPAMGSIHQHAHCAAAARLGARPGSLLRPPSLPDDTLSERSVIPHGQGCQAGAVAQPHAMPAQPQRVRRRLGAGAHKTVMAPPARMVPQKRTSMSAAGIEQADGGGQRREVDKEVAAEGEEGDVHDEGDEDEDEKPSEAAIAAMAQRAGLPRKPQRNVVVVVVGADSARAAGRGRGAVAVPGDAAPGAPCKAARTSFVSIAHGNAGSGAAAMSQPQGAGAGGHGGGGGGARNRKAQLHRSAASDPSQASQPAPKVHTKTFLKVVEAVERVLSGSGRRHVEAPTKSMLKALRAIARANPRKNLTLPTGDRDVDDLFS